MSSFLDPIIVNMTDELVKARRVNQSYCFAQNDFYDELSLMWEEILEIAQYLKGFGNPIKFDYTIKTSNGEETLKFVFNPYYIDKKYDDKECEIFYCDFKKEEPIQKGKVKCGFYFSFYPDLKDFSEEDLKEREARRKKAIEEDIYLDDSFYFYLPNYIFLQIYDKKDKFLNELREQCIDTLQLELEHTKYINLLINKYKKKI